MGDESKQFAITHKQSREQIKCKENKQDTKFIQVHPKMATFYSYRCSSTMMKMNYKLIH